ncbi:MAG: hypothetical protein FJY83_08385, partial [Candidatus Aminicenantes bacterium]|nr:hypothetical protein [Candidatus Aminicenantes bacterium]
MNTLAAKLEEKIRNKTARVGVIGLGYVGLPLVKAFLQAGFRVTGFDIDRRKIEMLMRGRSYIRHISASELKRFLSLRLFSATDDFRRMRSMEAVIICVPTPLDNHRNPDLSFVLDTTRVIARHLVRGQLIILESTTYPGTTDEEMLPILEKGGLKVGRDFFLAYSPEREDPGNKQFDTRRIPKVVGGVSRGCLRTAKA